VEKTPTTVARVSRPGCGFFIGSALEEANLETRRGAKNTCSWFRTPFGRTVGKSMA
jgi:hypothetical protein